MYMRVEFSLAVIGIVDGTHKIRPNTPVIPVDVKKVFKAGK